MLGSARARQQRMTASNPGVKATAVPRRPSRRPDRYCACADRPATHPCRPSHTPLPTDRFDYLIDSILEATSDNSSPTRKCAQECGKHSIGEEHRKAMKAGGWADGDNYRRHTPTSAAFVNCGKSGLADRWVGGVAGLWADGPVEMRSCGVAGRPHSHPEMWITNPWGGTRPPNGEIPVDNRPLGRNTSQSDGAIPVDNRTMWLNHPPLTLIAHQEWG